SLKTETDKMNNIWSVGYQDTKKEISEFVFTRVNFIGNVQNKKNKESKESSNTLTLIDINALFHTVHTSAIVPFIQLVEDQSKIIYKVLKNHTILTTHLQQWLSYANVPRVQKYKAKTSTSTISSKAMLVCMFHKGSRQNYARVTIDGNGQLYIQYKIDSVDKNEWAAIHRHVLEIQKWFESSLAKKVATKLESMYLRAEIPMSRQLSLKEYAKLLTKNKNLFHLMKTTTNRATIDMSYKRSVKYNKKMDIIEYIGTRIGLGIPMSEVATDLVDVGLSTQEAFMWIEQYVTVAQNELLQANAVQAPQNVKKIHVPNGCILHVQNKVYKVILTMENVSSIEEATRIARWLRGALVYGLQLSESDQSGDRIPKVPQKVSVIKSSVSNTSISSPKSKDSKYSVDSDGSDLNDLNDTSLELSDGDLNIGGAVGKQNQRYLLTQLMQADPMFKDSNYAGQCQANNFRQPIVVSPSEKANIDASGYSNSIDNNILYG
ncbi:MAG: hypothetical protein EB127_26090, partial [Alphaproteobacteria bacterium]|nr:hypothetical protein [Alphaproteobacteria bacterium]